MECGGRDTSRPSATPEEEAFKMNTDCIYFLASPLTCKKGADCEYRHSEGARVNPRDCWFWLNGNCLNPKCSFRHLPVDGLAGTPAAPVTDLPKQASAPAQMPASHAPAVIQKPNKQTAPCYYFQNGACLKGDRCAFMHVFPPVINPILQQAPRVTKPVSEQSPTFKNMSWSLNKAYYEKSNSKMTADKQVLEVTSSTKHISESGVLPSNGIVAHNETRPARLEIEIAPRSHASNLSLHNGIASSRPPTHKSQPLDDHLQHYRDAADDLLHESSSGFDVLVDTENEDIENLNNESEFNDNAGHDERNPGRIKDFEYYQSIDYNNAAKEQYDETGDYDCQARGHYSQKRYRTSDRILDRPFIQEKRPRKAEGSVAIDDSDLRHRLKQRRSNGSQTTSPGRYRNYKREQRSAEEHRNTSVNSHKNVKQFPHEGSLSQRLQGRITLCGRRTASIRSDSYSGGDIGSGTSGRRESPGRPVSYQGRIHDRLYRRPRENFSSETWNSGLSSVRRDNVESQLFSGPKSHAELKGSRIPSVNCDRRPSGNNSGSLSREQKSSRLEKALGCQNDESISFEGPMPLSVILRRKRGLNSGNHINSARGRDGEEEVGTASNGYISVVVTEMDTCLVSQGTNNPTLYDIREPEVGADERQEEGLTIEDVCELGRNQHAQSSAREDIIDFQNDLSADNMENLEIDNYEGGIESEYDEGEDYKIDDNEDAYYEGLEDLNDADGGNDFARLQLNMPRELLCKSPSTLPCSYRTHSKFKLNK